MRILLTACVVLLAVSCGRQTEYDELLVRAEQLSDRQPVEALLLLQQYDSVPAKDSINKHLYSLVYHEAARNQGVNFKNVSVMKPAVDCFRNAGDRQRMLRAMLQCGLCCLDNHCLVGAAQWLKQLEQASEKSGTDVFTRQKLYEALAALNLSVGNTPLMLRYYDKALEAAEGHVSPAGMAVLMQNMAYAYFRLGLTDSLRSIVSSLNTLSCRLGSTERDAVEGVNGLYCLSLRDTVKAVKLLAKGINADRTYIYSLTLGNVLAAEGNSAGAERLWYDAANSMDDRISREALTRLLRRVEPSGDNRRVMFLMRELNKVYTTAVPSDTVAAVIQVQTEYDKAAKAASEHFRYVFSGIVLSVAAAVLAVLYVRHRRRVKRIKDDERNWNIEERLLNSECVYALHRLAATGKAALKDDIDAAHVLVTGNDRKLSKLLSRHRNMSAVEINVAILTRLRFTPGEIATLLSVSPQTVTNVRVRLLGKVFGLKGGARDFDRQINEL